MCSIGSSEAHRPESLNEKGGSDGSTKTVSQQGLQIEPALRSPVVARRHAQQRSVPDARGRLRLDRGATAPVTSKQEAEKTWEPKFITEIASGKDPRIVPEREKNPEELATIADLLEPYRARYVDVEPLRFTNCSCSQATRASRRRSAT
jgi:hypothetical protein